MDTFIQKTNNTINWDNDLEYHGGSVFLSSQWLEALRSEHRNPVYFIFKAGTETKAMIAGLERPVGTGHNKQLFFFSGIATNSPDEVKLRGYKKLLLNYSRQQGYCRVIMKSYDYTNYITSKTDHYNEFKRAECVIDLKKGQKALISNIESETRRLVRKSKRQGVELKHGYSPELVDTLFELMGNTHTTRNNKGYGSYRMYTMPFLDREVILKLLEKKAARLHYAEHQGEIISMQFIVAAAGRAYGIWMGTSQKGYKLWAPSALTYQTIMDYNSMGFASLNMGGVPLGSSNNGVLKYKMNFGPAIVESSEQTTDFLLPPLTRVNTLMHIKRGIDKLHVPWPVKKAMLQIPDAIIRGRDSY